MAQDVLPKNAVITTELPTMSRRIWWNFSDTVVMTRRNLLHYPRLPQLLVFSTIQPIMFVLLFAYVFGGAIATPNGSYINYLMPGIMIQAVLFGGTATAVGLAADLSKGLIDRFRSLPMARAAVLAGRTLADTVRNVFVVLLMVFVGTLIGFRFSGSLAETLLALAIVVAFGYAMSWIFALVGMFVRDPETAQVAGFIWVFPLVFASSVFVPTQTMPDWLQVFAENQPITIVTNTVRQLILDMPVTDLGLTFAWIIGIWLLFATLSVRQYRKVV